MAKKSVWMWGIIGVVAAIGMNVNYVLAVPGGGGAPGGGVPGGSAPGGAPGGMSQSSVSYNGATTLSSDTSLEGMSYASTTGGQNALLVSGGTATLTKASVTKSGDESDENSDFYGTNAAVLVYNGANLIMDGGTVETNGAHANGVFAYGEGKAVLNGVTIKTTQNNSGGVMVTGGGTLEGHDLSVTTQGGSSAAIRSDRGGGTMKLYGGWFETNGQGSPAIYSTADVMVEDGELVSNASEGVVIEGSNAVTLKDAKLTDTNNTLNGNSETYKNIFIYQSMSGDAEEGEGTFTAENSEIITNQGDTFFVTNTTAVINLTNNQFTNNDTNGVFLRAQAGKWGNAGSNGGQVELTMNNQEVRGDVVLDAVSSLSMSVKEGSYYRGVLNGSNEASEVSMSLDADAVVVLEGDSYVTSLANAAGESNQNVYLNGHKLYVNGSEVEGNTGTPPEGKAVKAAETVAADCCVTNPEGTGVPLWVWLVGSAAIVAALVAVSVIYYKHERNARRKNTSGSGDERGGKVGGGGLPDGQGGAESVLRGDDLQGDGPAGN